MKQKQVYKYIIPVALSVMLITVIGIRIFEWQVEENDLNHNVDYKEVIDSRDETIVENVEKVEPLPMFVDVKGAIKVPGVYEMKKGHRMKDVIARAGGFLETADQTKVNLAMLLEDEMVIYVPKVGEEVTNPLFTTEYGKSNDGKVAINIATSDEIQTLPGVGPSKAEAIIRYRDENGPFQTPEDLLNVTGIGEKSLEKLKEKIILP